MLRCAELRVKEGLQRMSTLLLPLSSSFLNSLRNDA